MTPRLRRILAATRSVVTSLPFLTIVTSVGFLLVLVFGLPPGFTVFLVIAFVAAWIATYEERDFVDRQVKALQDYTVHVEGDELVHCADDGTEVGRIDLKSPFEVSIPYRASGVGIIRVVQGEQIVDFASTSPGAESVARSALGLSSWPPDAPWNSPF